MACSGVITTHLIREWPCARYSDNIAKIVNELSFMAVVLCAAYIKEM